MTEQITALADCYEADAADPGAPADPRVRLEAWLWFTCPDKLRAELRKELARRGIDGGPNRSEAARLLRLQPRRPKEKVCPVCGQTFTTTGRGIYDRPACRQKAWAERQRPLTP
jgi:hypothetical protein